MNLQAQEVSVSIDGLQIVKNVSLDVQKNRFVGIIGANGCGKSTLLKSIYKIIKPKAKVLRLDDMDILKTSEKKLAQKHAVVSQFNELSFDFSVFDMVMMGRAPFKKLMESDSKKDAQAVIDALERVHLLHLKDRSYLSLSGGEKQRVILARAIVQEPQFLILDEPTNHLDVKYQLEVLNIVKGLGITVLAVLHDLDIVARYCDYIYAMKNGEILLHGTPKEVISKEAIKEIYDVNAEVYENPITRHLSVAYL